MPNFNKSLPGTSDYSWVTMTFFQPGKSEPWGAVAISISQVRDLMCEQRRGDGDRWTKSERNRWGRWIIAEPEKELTLLLSHYSSSGGTNRFNSKRGRKIIRREGGSGRGTVAETTTTTRRRWRSERPN